ncbi:MAG: OmpH family outer membrane protein [Verrucomicrobia bacterium]|nr:OmpH family outer membrane protein [Cytophagales bacterium]
MKNLSFIPSFCLVLFTILFAACNKNSPGISSNKDSVSVSNLPIAYINTDSLQTQYLFYKDIKNELESQGANLDNELTSKKRAFENEVVYFQQKQQRGELSMADAQAAGQRLQMREQELAKEQELTRLKFAQEQQAKNDQLYKKVTEYLKTYCKEKKYQYVLGYTKTSPIIFYAESSLDITTDVVKGLNEAYKAEKEKPTVSEEKDKKK